MRLTLIFCFLSLFFLAGCHSKPVRHLASDAALIKPGQTTVEEVQKYLGEPKGHRDVSPGVVEYVYYEDRPGFFGNTPMLKSLSGPSGYEMIVLTIENDVVINCEFRNYSKYDHEWADDFTWDEVK